jgi:hypothetical protein
VFNGAIDHVIQNNPKARHNPRGLSQLDGYKRGLVNSLTGNLHKFGLDRVPKVKTLDEPLKPAIIPPQELSRKDERSRREVLTRLFDLGSDPASWQIDQKSEKGVFRRRHQKAGTAGFTPHTMIDAARLGVDEIAGI